MLMDDIHINFSVSSLKDHEMIATYCGLRPRSPEFHDYQIRFNKDLSWATLGAIRSTGLTASRSIAEYCAKNLFSNEPYEVGYPQLLSKNISGETGRNNFFCKNCHQEKALMILTDL